MKIQPLNDHVLIEPLSTEQKLKSGIVLPDTADKEKPQQGKVIAVGAGKLLENGKRQALEIKKGDKVLFTKYGPHEIKIDSKEYLIAKEEDILAILS